jgi:hypothetical protein
MADATAQPALPTSRVLSRLSGMLPSSDQFIRSEVVWLGVVAYLVLAKILSETLVPIGFRGSGQGELFAWSNVALFSTLGFIGLWCGRATGFPEAWDARITAQQRLLVPAAIGLALGGVESVLDVMTAGSQAVAKATGQSSFNIDFPGSLLAYSGGAIQVEVLYRLFALPLLMWLVSSVVLRGRGQQLTLLVIGSLSAAFEPVGQGVLLFLGGDGVITPLMLAAYLATALPSNILAVIMFRRSGLLAPLTLRWAEYLIWHIVYGNFLYGAVFPTS